MTVSYTGDVANGSSFGCFWKILGRWKGSVYKLIWRELIAYLFLYFSINLIYRHGMSEEQRETFEKVKVYCSKQIESIPMSFVLGFYVSLIVKRWWDQYWILPLPDSLALYISASIHGQNERGRLLRRTIMRYTMLAYIITLQRISFRVKKRFPTLQHLVDTGLMMDSEKKIFDTMEAKTKVSKFWMPIVWASNLVNLARQEGRIHSDHMVQTILMELSDFRRKLGRVMVYDNVSVPLVYTQVVTLAVYTYFVAALIGRQWVVPKDGGAKIYPGYELDLYFPIFLSLQFIFYIGWLKVAETLINPFGEDDDDFELNWLIDRHIKVSYMVVDEMHEEHPELLKDYYWEQKVPKSLPYNIASEQFRRNEPQGSTASMKIKLNESVYDNLPNVKRHSVIQDEVYAEYESVADSPLADNRKNWLQRQMSRVESFRSTSSSSSLFNRNRLQANNGQLPNGYPQGASGHHRLSLYERLMNRRSSKDILKNSLRMPGHGNRQLNTLTVGKDNMNSLIPLPNSRPRVPTPDVTKENQLNLMTAAPTEKTGGRYQNNISSVHNNQPYPLPGANGGPPNHISPNSGNQNNTAASTVPQTPPGGSGYGGSYNNSTGDEGGGGGRHNNNTTTKNGSPPPPPYDATDSSTHPILTPIAEHDGSPYSTSSTSRSSRSSHNYPTTTAIFGRKQSPSPPQDELPPIPTVTVGSKSDWSNGGGGGGGSGGLAVKAHFGNGGLHGGGQGKFHIYRLAESEMEDVNADSAIHALDRALSNQNSIDEEPYMTIAEVNESKEDFQVVQESAVGPQLPPPYRPSSSYNSQSTSHSFSQQPPSFPLPLPPLPHNQTILIKSQSEPSGKAADKNNSGPVVVHNVSNAGSTVSRSDRSRKISVGMQRQNALLSTSAEDDAEGNFSSSSVGGAGHQSMTSDSPTQQQSNHHKSNFSSLVDNDNVDDGYDERGSYNEEEELLNIHPPEILISRTDQIDLTNFSGGAAAPGGNKESCSSENKENSCNLFSQGRIAKMHENSCDKCKMGNGGGEHNSDSGSSNGSQRSIGNSNSSIGSYNENGSTPSPRSRPKSSDNIISSSAERGTILGTPTAGNISKDCEVFV